MFHRRERMTDGQVIEVDEGYITESMMDPGAKIVAGYKNVMPTFSGRLASPESAAIVEFIKSLHTPQKLPSIGEGGPAYEPTRAR
jgi:cytochrome c oxidase subunit 2